MHFGEIPDHRCIIQQKRVASAPILLPCGAGITSGRHPVGLFCPGPGFIHHEIDECAGRQRLAILPSDDAIGWSTQKTQKQACEDAGYEVADAKFFERSQSDFRSLLER
ncbi:MAG: hypothetical protein ACK5JE_07095 [Castellaniella sp.]|uniref:hypothetical protein n=1 Tax=Castellaniella sp. TaxID=1955812 RepID=UPI003A8AAC4E